MILTEVKGKVTQDKSRPATQEVRLQKAQHMSTMSHFNWFAKYDKGSSKKS